MSKLFNPETEATDLDFKAITIRPSKGKPGVNVDFTVMMDLDGDEFGPGLELPGRLAKLTTAAFDATQGGDSIKHEVTPDLGGKLVMHALVDGAAEDAFEGAALLRRIRLAATKRYVRCTWVFRVHMNRGLDAGAIADLLPSTVRVQFTPAQGVLPMAEKSKPKRGKGKDQGDNNAADHVIQ